MKRSEMANVLLEALLERIPMLSHADDKDLNKLAADTLDALEKAGMKPPICYFETCALHAPEAAHQWTPETGDDCD